MIVTAVVLISIFPSEGEQLTKVVFSEEETKRATHLAVMWGLIGGICYSLKLLITKWLKIRRDIAGDVSGITFQLVEGTIGTVCLIIRTL